MGEGGFKIPEKLLTSFMDGPNCKQPLIIDDTNNEIDDSFHQWIQRRENLFTNYKLSFLARRDGCVGCWYCITYLAVIE